MAIEPIKYFETGESDYPWARPIGFRSINETLIKWCNENIGPGGHRWPKDELRNDKEWWWTDSGRIYFKSHKARTMFLLRWK